MGGGPRSKADNEGTPQVSRHNNDLIMKRVVGALRGAFLQRFKLSLPEIVAALPTEFPLLEVRAQNTDLLFRLADASILHLEFQTTTRREDLWRFAGYNLAVHQNFGQPVHTVVLYGPGMMSAPDARWRIADVPGAQPIYWGAGWDAIQRVLREKAQSGVKLSVTDRLDIMLLH